MFWGVLRAKVTLFAVFFAGCSSCSPALNLLIADRLAPATFPANIHPSVERFHEFFGHRLRLLRLVVAGVLGDALRPAGDVGHWQDWLMFRNAESFGITDPQFHDDVGFYVFQLPFLTFVLDWLFVALIVMLLLTVATHVLNGGDRVRLAAAARPPRRPRPTSPCCSPCSRCVKAATTGCSATS